MNNIRKIWQERGAAVLGWLQIPSPAIAEVLGRSGYDGLVVDLQHGFAELSDAAAMFRAIESAGAEPIVRLQENRPADAMKLLDLGAYGVIVPLVDSADDAKTFVSALHYPPGGQRSYGPRRPVLRYGPDYWKLASQTIVSLAMIETRRGIDNLDAILAVEGYDGIFIGPSDLAIALGRAPTPDSDDPVVVDAIRHIRERARVFDKRVGIFCMSAAFGRAKIMEGFDIVSIAPDLATVAKAAREAIAIVRGA